MRDLARMCVLDLAWLALTAITHLLARRRWRGAWKLGIPGAFALSLSVESVALGAPIASAVENPVFASMGGITNCAQVRQSARIPMATNLTVRVEAVVRGVFPEMGLTILQDATGAAGMQLDLLRFPLRAGQRIRIEGCGRFGNGCTALLPSVVLDNDGLHSEREVSGQVHLARGFHPFQLNYVQNSGPFALRLEYEGPGVSAQPVPPNVLFHSKLGANGAEQMEPGLRCDYYEGSWGQLPDFNRVTPVQSKTVNTVNPDSRKRDEAFALRFSGLLQIRESGLYTFRLVSDDGSQLLLQTEPVRVTLLGEVAAEPAGKPKPLRPCQLLHEDEAYSWASVEGSVSFVSRAATGWELELSSDMARMKVFLAGSAERSIDQLRNVRVRVTGFVQETFDTAGNRVAGGLLAPRIEHLSRLDATDEKPVGAGSEGAGKELPVLTTAEQVRQLKPTEATRGYPVRLRGVVTDRHSAVQGVVQDATSGVYVQFESPDGQGLGVGSFCELSGVTSPGGFAPIVVAQTATCLGAGLFPTPLRPDYGQLIDGSMDSQWVEIEGMVSRVLPFGDMRLAIKGGHVTAIIIDHSNLQFVEGLSNAFVRVRGCAIPRWNETRQVVGDVIIRVPSVACITVDENTPADPFRLPVKRVAELSQFDPRIGEFRWTTVRGQVVHVTESAIYLADGANGLRFVPRGGPRLAAGDLVEVAGLPEFAGASPLLREALVRKIGHDSLPAPPRAALEEVARGSYDSRRVQIDGRLISSRARHGGFMLELQSDLRVFEASYQTNAGAVPIPPLGSRLAVCGVVARPAFPDSGGPDTFELLVGGPGDITCLELPPRWTLKHALALIAVLTVVLLAAALWIALLRRTVEQRTRERRAAEAKVRALELRGALETQRARIARDIHDDLGARATKLSRLASQVHAPGADLPRYLDEISATSRQVVETLDETVWTVNPANDSLAGLADYIIHFADEFFRGTNIRCQLSIPVDLPPQPVTAEFRHSVFLLVKEALNNVLKHSASRVVLLRLGVEGQCLHLSVQDDGQGFIPGSSASAGGNGLVNMRERAAVLGGRCELKSGPGAGTVVEVEVPLLDLGTRTGV